jgi:hypothetical protein
MITTTQRQRSRSGLPIEPAAGLPTMRLLTVDARTTGRDRAALARLIESADADVACVHHGPHLLRWRSICAALGRRSGLVVVTGGRPAGANLVLSTLGVDVFASQDLAWPQRRWSGARVRRPAGAALAGLKRQDTPFVLVSATLAGVDTARAGQAAQVHGAAASLVPGGLPTVLSVEGVRPGDEAWLTLTANHVDVSGRVFVDRRLGVAESHEVTGGVVVQLDGM